VKSSSLIAIIIFLIVLLVSFIAIAVIIGEPVVRILCVCGAILWRSLGFILWKRHHRGEFVINADGMSYTGWKRPVRFTEIKSLSGQKTYTSIAVTFHLKEKQTPLWRYSWLPLPTTQLKLQLSGLEGKPATIFETIGRYITRQVEK